MTEKLKARYHLKYIGIMEAGDEQYYKAIELNFQIFRILSKDQETSDQTGITN